ncbi:MAG: hypothetical protein HOD03_02080 [Planctomycetes bacterium]|nr:hypothetical protein [Planctomycetota bacterium]
MHNAATNETSIVPMRIPMIYQRRISVSPNYDIDGRLLVAGNVHLYEWQSPDVAPSNPDFKTLWYMPSVLNLAANGSDAGYPRGVKYSPNFDPTGTVANADQTFFWFSAQGQMRRSSDNGATSERLFNTTMGAATEPIQCMTVAPTYDATGARTDVYSGTRDGVLYRLMNDKWEELHNFNDEILKLLVAPNYSRPNNPTLFALMKKSPFVYKITDTITGPVNIEPLRSNLSAVAPSGIALHPDFSNTPIIYIATKANGALLLDLSDSLPLWSPFGDNIPAAAVDDIALSKNFATDGIAYLATSNDIMKLDFNNDWQDLNGVFRLDDTDDSLTTYSPNNPTVIDPSHAWPWRNIRRSSLPFDLQGTGDEVLFADYDGDYFTCPVRGTEARLMTFQGPRQGKVFLELIDPNTGNVVTSQTYDLNNTLANISESIIGIDIPDPTKIYTFKMTAILGIGEKVAIDGVEIKRN